MAVFGGYPTPPRRVEGVGYPARLPRDHWAAHIWSLSPPCCLPVVTGAAIVPMLLPSSPGCHPEGSAGKEEEEEEGGGGAGGESS